MNFGFPLFLWALFALSIPLLIHLFNLRRPKTVYFSNTRFLKQLEQQTKSVKKLRHWLLLLLRSLAIAALVFAFMLPFSSDGDEPESNKETFIHLYVDNSLSMQRDGEQGPLLNQARIEAANMLNAWGENSQIQFLCNDLESRYQQYYSAKEAINLLEQLEYSPSFRSIDEILNRIRNVSQANPEANHQIVMLSDFQAGILSQQTLIQKENESVSLVPLKPVSKDANIAIDSIQFKAPVFLPGLDQEMKVYLKNYGLETQTALSLDFLLNDTLVTARLIDLAPQSQEVLTLNFSPKHSGVFKGLLRINKGLPKYDNELHFSFQTINKQAIYFISNELENDLPLQIFDQSFFDFKQDPAKRLDYDYFANARLIVLKSFENFPLSLLQQLKAHLKQGKNIWLFPAENDENYSQQLEDLGIAVNSDWFQDSLMSQKLNYKDPFLFKAFVSEDQQVQLPYTKKYLVNADGASISLLELNPKRPLLQRKKRYNGQVFYSLTKVESSESNIASHPIMVPLLANAALYTKAQAKTYIRSGKPGDYQQIDAPKSERALTIELETGSLIPAQVEAANYYHVSLPQNTLKSGAYPLMRNDSLMAYLAVNSDARESVLGNLTNELNTLFSPEALLIKPGSNSDQQVLMAKVTSSKNQLWSWFVAFVLLLLSLELILLKSRTS